MPLFEDIPVELVLMICSHIDDAVTLFWFVVLNPTIFRLFKSYPAQVINNFINRNPYPEIKQLMIRTVIGGEGSAEQNGYRLLNEQALTITNQKLRRPIRVLCNLAVLTDATDKLEDSCLEQHLLWMFKCIGFQNVDADVAIIQAIPHDAWQFSESERRRVSRPLWRLKFWNSLLEQGMSFEASLKVRRKYGVELIRGVCSNLGDWELDEMRTVFDFLRYLGHLKTPSKPFFSTEIDAVILKALRPNYTDSSLDVLRRWKRPTAAQPFSDPENRPAAG